MTDPDPLAKGTRTDILAALVAGAMTHVAAASNGDDPRCCPHHCPQCWALAQLLGAGQLDFLYAAQLGNEDTGRDDLWDPERLQADREYLAQAWAPNPACCGKGLAVGPPGPVVSPLDGPL